MKKKCYNSAVIEIVKGCNIHCFWCPWEHSRSKNKLMSFDTFKRTISFIKQNQIQRIVLQETGEATLHPKLLDFIDYSHKEGLKSTLNTNGTILTISMLNQLQALGLDKLCISIYDLGDNYSYMRKANHYSNLRFLLKEFSKVNYSKSFVIEIMSIIPPKVKFSNKKEFFNLYSKYSDTIYFSKILSNRKVIEKDYFFFENNKSYCPIPCNIIFFNYRGHILPCVYMPNDKAISSYEEQDSLKKIFENFIREHESNSFESYRECMNCDTWMSEVKKIYRRANFIMEVTPITQTIKLLKST